MDQGVAGRSEARASEFEDEDDVDDDDDDDLDDGLDEIELFLPFVSPACFWS